MKTITTVIAGVALAAAPVKAATTFSIYTGYADNDAHSSGAFLPSPWVGDPGVVSQSTPGGYYDSGAIRIDNTGTTPLDVSNMTVTFAGQVFTLWGPLTVPAGDNGIFTQTTTLPVYPGGNFDTSEELNNATISFDVGSVPFTFPDKNVLDTGGIDPGADGVTNEGLPWTLIGSGNLVTTPVPEPTSMAAFGLALLGLGLVRRRR